MSGSGEQRGMTLIELIIGMAIGAIVATLCVFILIATIRTQGTVSADTAASTRLQVISETIDRAVRNARALAVCADGSCLTVRRTDGVCEVFRAAADGVYYRKAGGTEVNLSSYQRATFAFEVAKLPTASPSPYFSLGATAAVTYSFRLLLRGAGSSDTSRVDVTSTVRPRVAAAGSPSC